MSDKKVVFIVDDDAAARDSVAALVTSKGCKALTFHSAEDFLSRYNRADGGCLVVDIRMGQMSGLDMLEAMTASGVRLQTIVISAFADVPLTVRAMRAGALTVLQKPYRDQELWEMISRALLVEADVRRNNQQVNEIRARLASLTDDERRVLELILTGTTNRTIATFVHQSVRTVESRRHSLMEKLGVRSLAELVHDVAVVRALSSPSAGENLFSSAIPR
jgi:two-component system, LuxR family, response regulator FixJ